jgi:hypothetical protein
MIGRAAKVSPIRCDKGDQTNKFGDLFILTPVKAAN